MRSLKLWVMWLLSLSFVAECAANLISNGGFEEGGAAPAGWQKPSQGGEWLKGAGVDGGGCVALTGDGENSAAWQSAPVEFAGGKLYKLSFMVRLEGGGGGCISSGPGFANVDIRHPGDKWSYHEHVFMVPTETGSVKVPVRLGQWHLKGTVFFDDVSLVMVEAAHNRQLEADFGENESLLGNHYAYATDFGGVSRNYSRTLQSFNARFNSYRWVFDNRSEVVYSHEVGTRQLLSGELSVNCGYRHSGAVVISARRDNGDWVTLGSATNVGTASFPLPAVLFPAKRLNVRMCGLGEPACVMQIHSYQLNAEVDGEPKEVNGVTHFLEVLSRGVRLHPTKLDLGDLSPGLVQRLSMEVINANDCAIESEVQLVFTRSGERPMVYRQMIKVSPRSSATLTIPYETLDVGEWRVDLKLGTEYHATTKIMVPDLFVTDYGEMIVTNDNSLSVWSASSSRKVPQYRRLPRKQGRKLALSLARNEWESIQLVVMPREELHNVGVVATSLRCGAHEIASRNIEILRVGYVPIQQTTDKTGAVASWPDPLLPQNGGERLAVGRNQPYWIRVNAPKGTPAGIYQGQVILSVGSKTVEIPLEVEVYDFELPDTSSCETAFGLNTGAIWRYHGLKDEGHKRLVLEKYLRTLSDYYISPYNPAPLDNWSVTWTGFPPWRGGEVVTNEFVTGKGSYLVVDDSDKRNVSATFSESIPLPAQGMKISFHHKCDKGQSSRVSLNFHRADGSWISGRNFDRDFKGAQEWRFFEAEIKNFPPEARECKLSIYAAGWQSGGEATGSLWLDDLAVVSLDTGAQLVRGGDFEPLDPHLLEPRFDWNRWDAAMEEAFHKYHFNTFVMRINGLGGGDYHRRREPSFMGYPETAPEYEILLGKYLRGIERHLEEKGWLDKAFIYWFDEPGPKDYEFVMNGFAKLKRHAPKLRRMLTEQIEPELIGGPNLWCPLSPRLNSPHRATCEEAGDQFWWYLCCVPKAPYATEFIDHPGTELRVWLWQTWGERVSGILVWAINYWNSSSAYPDKDNPQNPYLDPMSWISRYEVGQSTKRPWGNGDGRFLYPPLAAADGKPEAPVLEGPVVCQRLEMLRDGIEDYEYFVTLRRLLEERGERLPAAELQAMKKLLEVPLDVSKSLTDFTKDSAPIEIHRDKLARAIVKLMRVGALR